MLQPKNNRWYLEGGGWETLGEGTGGQFLGGDRIKLNLRAEDVVACADESGWVQLYVSRRPTPDKSGAAYTHSVYFRGKP